MLRGRIQQPDASYADCLAAHMFYFCSQMEPIIRSRCGCGMMPWRQSQAWRAMTCWACLFVEIERIDEKGGRAVASSGGPGVDTSSGVPARVSAGDGYKIV